MNKTIKKIREIGREAFRRKELIAKVYKYKAYWACIILAGVFGMGLLGFFIGQFNSYNIYLIMLFYLFSLVLFFILYYKYTYYLALSKQKQIEKAGKRKC